MSMFDRKHRMNQAPVSKRTWDSDVVTPQDVQDLATGIGRHIDSQPVRKISEFDALYTEPMYLSLIQNPIGIVCLRVRQVNAPESAVLSGGAVHWAWDGSNSRAKILSIDGMSPGSGLTYTFTFETCFKPVIGT